MTILLGKEKGILRGWEMGMGGDKCEQAFPMSGIHHF